MIATPEITHSAAKLIAYIPLVVPASEIRTHMGPGIAEVLAAVSAQGVADGGAWFTHHNHQPNAVFDFKICVPIKSPVAPVGRVLCGELASCKVARTIYRGSYDGLGAGWGALMQWILTQGLQYREDLWEVYDKGPQSVSEPSLYETELNRPLV